MSTGPMDLFLVLEVTKMLHLNNELNPWGLSMPALQYNFLPHLPKIETVKIHFFQDQLHPPKVVNVINQFFQDHQTLPK